MTDSQNSAPRAVRCEAHGLLYNPNQSEGCVLCRREAGVAAPATASKPAQSSSSGGAMPRALAVTAGLVLVTSLGLYSAHKSVVGMFSGIFSGAAFEGGGGFSSEDLSKAGTDPRLEKYLKEIEKLDEIEAKRFGVRSDDSYSDDGYDEGYGDDEYDDGY